MSFENTARKFGYSEQNISTNIILSIDLLKNWHIV